LTGCQSVAGSAPQLSFFERIGSPIGLQLYTLGPDAGVDLDATFASIARIGYRDIELPSLLGREAGALRAAADRAGLTISSLHLPLVSGRGAPGLSSASPPTAIAEALDALGASWAVAPLSLVPEDFRPAADESFGDAISRSVLAAGVDLWKKTAASLNETATALKPFDIRLGYHNHSLEFAPVDGTTGWDILWDETEPDLVSFEVDVGWVATAGIDPVAFLERSRGRVRLLHVKDVAPDNRQSFQISMTPAEVGAGSLDWERILPAAHNAGVNLFYVEQEPPFVIPRIEAAERSFAFLSRVRA